jgi:hypothetical protein
VLTAPVGRDLVQAEEMNYFEAVALLNRAKDGQPCGFSEITKALCLTGDREFPSDVRSPSLGEGLQRKTENDWEISSVKVVEHYSRRHRENQRQESPDGIKGANE